MPRRAASVRARNREDLVREIVEEARRQLIRDGAAALSLRAVAREVGMVSSAVYRYVASRDDLLTLLIVDAYDALADAVEAAEATVDRADVAGRWSAFCHAARQWAMSHPQEYALIYGSPVPGYRGNDQTTRAAGRTTTLLAGILRDAVRTSAPARRRKASVTGQRDPEVPLPVQDAFEVLLETEVFSGPDGVAGDIPPNLLMRGLMGWVEVFGLISFELFGQFANAIDDTDALFDHAVTLLGADFLG